jgi:PilZ domain
VSENNRKKQRKPVSMAGFIYTIDGWPISECKMLDISEGGAKLSLSSSETVPDEFLLSLSRNGNVRRRCHLRWRKEGVFGVRFT